jgi:glyoxylase-like metal-dependent hydrolase (beta-lactamase superfamily II)
MNPSKDKLNSHPNGINIQINFIDLPTFWVNAKEMYQLTDKLSAQQDLPNTTGMCELGLQSMLISDGENTILIDTGFYSGNRKVLQEYSVNNYLPIEIILGNKGIRPESITHVIHTHLHIDHCGGSFNKNNKDKIEATFPFAQYIVSKNQLEEATNPSKIESDSFDKEIIEAFNNYHHTKLITGETFLFPWLEIGLSNGHTKGLIVPILHLKGKTILFAGDMIPTHYHYQSHITSLYDQNPLLIIAEREEIISSIEDEKPYEIVFQHDSQQMSIIVN